MRFIVSNLRFVSLFAFALVVLILNSCLAFFNITRLADNEKLVSHTHEVLYELENVFSLAKDAETGARGYIITGKRAYLEPYFPRKNA